LAYFWLASLGSFFILDWGWVGFLKSGNFLGVS